jgi:hypothetical protein
MTGSGRLWATSCTNGRRSSLDMSRSWAPSMTVAMNASGCCSHDIASLAPHLQPRPPPRLVQLRRAWVPSIPTGGEPDPSALTGILLRTAESDGLAALGVAATGSRLITGAGQPRKLAWWCGLPGMSLVVVLLGFWFRFAVWIVVFLEFPGQVRR